MTVLKIFSEVIFMKLDFKLQYEFYKIASQKILEF